MDRPLEIEILDSSNEAKFEKLLKDEKLISPFKVATSKSSSSTGGDQKTEAATIKSYDSSVLAFKIAENQNNAGQQVSQAQGSHKVNLQPPKEQAATASSRKLVEAPQQAMSSQGNRPEHTAKRRHADGSPVANKAGQQLSKRARTTDDKQRTQSVSSSSSSCDSANLMPPFKVQYEKDQQMLERRQKQIDFGKNTVGYDNYISMVPKMERTREHPKTPPMHLKYSRRAWDGLVKKWRIQLHEWDPEVLEKKAAEQQGESAAAATEANSSPDTASEDKAMPEDQY